MAANGATIKSLHSAVKSHQQQKNATRPPPEPESLRKLRALKERITREYEQEKAEREAMENNEPPMPLSLANEKGIITMKDGSSKQWSGNGTMLSGTIGGAATAAPIHPARLGYGNGHIPLQQEPFAVLKDKLYHLKTGNKSWQHELEAELGGKFGEISQLKAQNRRLREILTLREASNSRKEARLESEIAQLKNLMDDVCIDTHEHDEIMSKLRNMNYEIQEKADLLKSTIEEQAEAERLALIRTYRVRIRDVKLQLSSQETVNLEGAKAWIARYELLEKDRADAAAHLATIEADNQALREAKTEIRVMQRHQDEQRQDLTHKIALVKRENKRFEEHIARLEQQLEQPVGGPVDNGGNNSMNGTLNNTSVNNSAFSASRGGRTTSSQRQASPARGASRAGAATPAGNGHKLFMTTASRGNTPSLYGYNGAGAISTSVNNINNTTMNGANGSNNTNGGNKDRSPGRGAGANDTNTIALTTVPQFSSKLQQNAEDRKVAEAIELQQTEAIAKIRKVLDLVRQSLRQVRSAHIELLQERTELEIFLRKCIEDVRRDMSRAVSTGADGGAVGAISAPAAASGGVNKFLAPVKGSTGSGGKNDTTNSEGEVILLQQYGVNERKQLMDILNSKLQLLTLLHQTMFPHKSLPEMLGDRLSHGRPPRTGNNTAQSSSSANGLSSVDEIARSIQFETDIDTLWQRWQTWVKTEPPAMMS